MANCPFSQFFVLSLRGDKILNKFYRDDIIAGTEELFLRKVKFWGGVGSFNSKVEAPPCFTIEGVNFIYVKKNSLYLVLVSRYNVSPSLGVELLLRICRLLKDYTGVLSEESLRKNFALVYEILDEVLDNGYVQTTSTDGLKYYIFNEPIEVEESSGFLSNLPFNVSLTEKKTVASNAARKPVIGAKDRKNEIFVDILEKINVVFNGDGKVLHNEILGSIVMKSFLNGNPEIRLGLNEDLIVGRHNKPQYAYGNLVIVDNMSFGEVVKTNEWESSKTLSLYPPDGEFTVVNYRICNNFAYAMPFSIAPEITVNEQYKIEAVFKLHADIPKTSHGSNVLGTNKYCLTRIVRIPVPKQTSNVAVDFAVGSDNTYEYKQAEKVIIWGIKKFVGQTDQIIRLKISLTNPLAYDVRKHIGPVSLKFEIPMHNVSGLQVKFLKIDQKAGNRMYTCIE